MMFKPSLLKFIFGGLAITYFRLLFIVETVPGIGWDAFSIKDVPIGVRVLSYVLFVCSGLLYFLNFEVLAGITGIVAFGILAFGGKS